MANRYTNSREYSASVIVPTFNRNELLRQTLGSLSRQTCKSEEFEVLICDDGSTEDTLSIVRQFADVLNLKYLFYPDHGYHPTRARNMGIRAAEGEILIFLDCGNLAVSNFVSAHVSVHQTPDIAGIGYCYGNHAWDDQPDALMEKLITGDVDSSVLQLAAVDDLLDVREDLFRACKEQLSNITTAWGLFWGGNVSVSKANAQKVGGFDENYTSWGVEDIDFGLALKMAGLRFQLSRDAAIVTLPHRKDKEFRLRSHEKNVAYMHSKYRNDDSRMLVDAERGYPMVKRELKSIGRL